MDNEAKRQRLENYLKYGVGLIGIAVFAPVIMLAIKGLLGLAVAGAMGLFIWRFAPVLAMKTANWQMKMIVGEAEANPIETMENLQLEKAKELETADQGIADFETEIRNFDDQVVQFKKDYPDEAVTYSQLAEKMHATLKEMKAQQSDARRQLIDFERQIDKARAIYKMAVAANSVVSKSGTAQNDLYAKIKERVAFDSVRTQLNRSFANLNLALERRTDSQVQITSAVRTIAAPQLNASKG